MAMPFLTVLTAPYCPVTELVFRPVAATPLGGRRDHPLPLHP